MFELHDKESLRAKRRRRVSSWMTYLHFRWVCALLLGVAGLSAHRAGDCLRTAHSFKILRSSQISSLTYAWTPNQRKKDTKDFPATCHEHPESMVDTNTNRYSRLIMEVE